MIIASILCVLCDMNSQISQKCGLEILTFFQQPWKSKLNSSILSHNTCMINYSGVNDNLQDFA